MCFSQPKIKLPNATPAAPPPPPTAPDLTMRDLDLKVDSSNKTNRNKLRIDRKVL